MTNHYPSMIASVRLSEAAITRAYELSPYLSKAVIKGLCVLQTRYPDRILATEYVRLHRYANTYDRYTLGSRTYTKIRIPIPLIQFLRFNKINMSAAAEWAILDAPRYLRLEVEESLNSLTPGISGSAIVTTIR